MGNETSVGAEDIFYKDAVWNLEFAWLPHWCDITKREIWFEWAYRGINKKLSKTTAYSRWITRNTWMVEKLKGTI